MNWIHMVIILGTYRRLCNEKHTHYSINKKEIPRTSRTTLSYLIVEIVLRQFKLLLLIYQVSGHIETPYSKTTILCSLLLEAAVYSNSF